MLHRRLVNAVRDGAYGLAHGVLRAAAHLCTQYLQVDHVKQSLQSVGHHLASRYLGPDVSHALVWHANVLRDHLDQNGVGLAGVEQLHHRNLQAFLVNFAAAVAAQFAADVRQM